MVGELKRKRPTRYTASADTGPQLAQALRTELDKLRSDIKATVAAAVHKEVRAAMMQLEAQASLLARINGQRPLPAMHGWPISPDFGLLITDLLDTASVREELRQSYALWLFQRERVTLAKAAEVADMSLYDFMALCKASQIPVMDISREELTAELAGLPTP